MRTRFCPSPTGHLHVGGARTALFNWLVARAGRGKFILRIDDTDPARSSEDSLAAILDSLEWLGIDWDEGPGKGGPHAPYRQSERLDLYREAAASLEERGLAYRCFCTAEELAERREAATKSGGRTGYDGRCRLVDPDLARRRRDAGEPSVLRFASPDTGDVEVEDLIRGEITFGADSIDDFVILRADSTPTFPFAGAYDDVAFGITHIIRGEDLLPVTPRQILLAEAMGAQARPIFAHLPLIVGADRAPLSKRHGDVAVSWYREAGFLPEALRNYLALLGWGSESGDEILDVDRLVSEFTLERVSRTPATFDLKKLDWMNNQYLQSADPETVLEAGLPFLAGHGLVSVPPSEHEKRVLERAIPLVQVRMDRLSELPEMVGFLLRAPEIVSEDWSKVMSAEWAHPLLVSSIEALETVAERAWAVGEIEVALREVAGRLGVKPRLAFGPVRVAVSGRRVGPPLFEALEILGSGATLGRMSTAASLYEAYGAELPPGRWPLTAGGRE